MVDRPTTGVTPFLAIRDRRAQEALGFYAEAFGRRWSSRTPRRTASA